MRRAWLNLPILVQLIALILPAEEFFESFADTMAECFDTLPGVFDALSDAFGRLFDEVLLLGRGCLVTPLRRRFERCQAAVAVA
jgi:hypothetical protein